jgi:NADH dehydrogenase
MKKIVIVGAGLAGLAAAKELRHSDAEVFVIDRTNHNLFQPLLYQVVTTVLFSGSNRVSDPWTSEKSEK